MTKPKAKAVQKYVAPDPGTDNWLAIERLLRIRAAGWKKTLAAYIDQYYETGKDPLDGFVPDPDEVQQRDPLDEFIESPKSE